MPRLTRDKHFRECRSLPFCYMCGEGFGPEKPGSRDHVPPRKVFAEADRKKGPVLTLRAHKNCNSEQSAHDEILGQLVGVLHRKYPKKHLRLNLSVVKTPLPGPPLVILRGIDLKRAVWRWIKGFHAALYREYLPSGVKANVHLPMPTGTEGRGGAKFAAILPQQEMMALELKCNRTAKRIDTIRAYGGKCRYECFWGRTSTGDWICIFGLNVYNWERLGDRRFRRRGCVGFYLSAADKPQDATTMTGLEFPTPSGEPLDPFH